MTDKVYTCFQFNYGDGKLHSFTDGDIAQMIRDRVKEKFPKTPGLDTVKIQRQLRKNTKGRVSKKFFHMKVFGVNLTYQQLAEVFGVDSDLFGNLSCVQFAAVMQRMKLSTTLQYREEVVHVCIRYAGPVNEINNEKIIIRKSVIKSKWDQIKVTPGFVSITPCIKYIPDPNMDPAFWINYDSKLTALNGASVIAEGKPLFSLLKKGAEGDYAERCDLTAKGISLLILLSDGLECCICNEKIKISGVSNDLKLRYEPTNCEHEVFMPSN